MRQNLSPTLLHSYLRPLLGVLLVTLALGQPWQGREAAAQQPDPGQPVPADEEGFDDEEEDPSAEGEASSTEVPDPAEEGDDLESLRAEYFKLRDRLFQSKARASAVASALYSTRLALRLDYKSARYYTITRATIRLDGANIYDDTSGAIASDDASRFEGYIAPGRHQLSIRIEATGKDDERFTSVIDNSFVVQASKGKDLDVQVSAEDGGDMPYKWSKKERGSYMLQMKVKVKTIERGSKESTNKRRGANRKDERRPERRG